MLYDSKVKLPNSTFISGKNGVNCVQYIKFFDGLMAIIL